MLLLQANILKSIINYKMSQTFTTNTKSHKKHRPPITNSKHRTNRTNRTDVTYRTDKTSTRQLDQYDEMFDEFNTMFITPQEQKNIHQILEFARKGKINPGNAFQIPVKVIDPSNLESTSLRFWKFASEILNVSMNIYDKRVENTFMTTHQIFNNLVRMKDNDSNEISDDETVSERKSIGKRSQKSKMQTQNYHQIKGSQYVTISKSNTEDRQKLNIKKEGIQFSKDPLFQQKLQAFDSDLLRCLFLNIFQCGKSLQITFFRQKIIKNEEQKWENIKLNESLERGYKNEKLPRFIDDQLNKLNFILQNRHVYENIGNYRKDNIKDYIQNRNTLRDFSKEFNDLNSGYCKSNNQITEIQTNQSIELTNISISKFDFKYVTQEDSVCNSEELVNHQTEQTPSNRPISQRFCQQFLIDQDENTMMTPRELQFRGMKLYRKPLNRSKRNQDQIKIRKQENNSIQIEFVNTSNENRTDIFKIGGDSQIISSDNCYQQKFIAKNMDPFFQIQRKRKRQLMKQMGKFQNIHQIQAGKSIKTTQCNEQLIYQSFRQDYPNSLKPFQSNTNQKANGREDSNNPNTQLSTHSTQSIQYFKMFGIKNIREIKEFVYSKILLESKIKISELEIALTPAATLIIFLHLANEKSLSLQSFDDENDVQIVSNG